MMLTAPERKFVAACADLIASLNWVFLQPAVGWLVFVLHEQFPFPGCIGTEGRLKI
jgi:hypothetical protein